MITTIEKFFAILVRLLQHEASKHAKASEHHAVKAHNHHISEIAAVNKLHEQGKIYRASLGVKADIHQRHADHASALASKIQQVLK